LTGLPVGQVLSHVTNSVRDADAFCVAEASTTARAIASTPPVPRGLRPWRVGETSFGNREISWLAVQGTTVPVGRLEARSR
jgi:hypothetical protein